MKLIIRIAFLSIVTNCYSQVQPKENWWMDEPYRLIQINLREIDAIDFDVDVYVKSLKDIAVNAVKSLVSDRGFTFKTNSEGLIELKIPALKCYDFILVEYK